jgi:hypothetical protein
MSVYHTQTLEMRGFKRPIFLEYFLTQGGILIDWDLIQGPDWVVRLAAEREIILGTLSLPVVFVTFEAPGEIALNLIQEFRMRFLSAGG